MQMNLPVLLIVILSSSMLRICIADERVPGSIEVDIDDETIINIARYGDDGDRILWIPTEFGIQQRHDELVRTVSDLGYEVWLSELHDSYFVPTGRKSYTGIPPDDIATLIEKSIPEDDRKLFIIATGRGAALALMAVQHLHNNELIRKKLGGLILIHPNLQSETPRPGSGMKYLPVVDHTRLPLFIIQPEKSEKYLYLSNLIERLTDAGSQLFTQVIGRASDGYHVKPDATDHEKQIARHLPSRIADAIRLLSDTQVDADLSDSPQRSDETWNLTTIPEHLQPYPGTPQAPGLVLRDIDGTRFDLPSEKGKVVVINFWATWCPPCVEELPSLARLQDAFAKDDLLVITIDTGENRHDVEKFLTDVAVDLPVLLDSDGNVFKQWRVTAFPTTFVINKKGLIELAYYGGLEWDKPDVIERLKIMTEE